MRLIIGDRRLGMVETAHEALPEAKIQRCVAHFCRNVSSKVPRSKMKPIANMLKAIHAQENEGGAGKGCLSGKGALLNEVK